MLKFLEENFQNEILKIKFSNFIKGNFSNFQKIKKFEIINKIRA